MQRHLKGNVNAPGTAKLGRFKPVLDEEFVKKVADYCIKMQTMFFGLTSDALRSLAYVLAERNGIVYPFNRKMRKAGPDFWLSSATL